MGASGSTDESLDLTPGWSRTRHECCHDRRRIQRGFTALETAEESQAPWCHQGQSGLLENDPAVGMMTLSHECVITLSHSKSPIYLGTVIQWCWVWEFDQSALGCWLMSLRCRRRSLQDSEKTRKRRNILCHFGWSIFPPVVNTARKFILDYWRIRQNAEWNHFWRGHSSNLFVMGNRTRQEVVGSMNVRFEILSHKWGMKQENTTMELKMDHFMGLHRASCWGPRVSCNSCARLKFKRLSRNQAAESWIETKVNFLVIQSSLQQPVHPDRCSSQSIQIDVHMLRDCHAFSRATSYFCLLGVHARNSEVTHRKTHIKLEATRKILKTSMSYCFFELQVRSPLFSHRLFLDWLIGQDKRQEGEAWFRTVGLLKLGPGRRDDALWRKVQGTVAGKKGFVCKQNCTTKRLVINRDMYETVAYTRDWEGFASKNC